MKTILSILVSTAIVGSALFAVSTPALAAKTASSAQTDKHNQKIRQEKALKEQQKQTAIMKKNSKK